MPERGRRAARLLAAALLLAAAPAAAAPDPVATRAQTIVQMLDYVAVDYPEAVKDGRIADKAEYQEQLDFVRQAVTMLGELPDNPERAALAAKARALVGLVEARRPGEEIARLSAEIRRGLIAAYRLPVAPAHAPDVRGAADLYAARCSACHGAAGRGDGPAGKKLEPPPTDFHDRERLDRRSVYALYSTITLGVRGTAMAAFADLTDDQRWALAFHVAGFAGDDAERRRGAALWERGEGRRAFGDLASIATAVAADVRARDGADAAAVLAHLRARPDLVVPAGGAALARSLHLLDDSVSAFRGGRAREARDLAVASYLDGFELIEPALDAVDRPLRVTIETEMIRFREMLRDGEPVAAVEAQADKLRGLLGDAQRVLSGTGLERGPAFASAFVILLREGLEAVLVVAAIVALLVRAGRRDALPAVHAGWILALVLGGVTWLVASYAVSISGATREVTEGVTALIAAVVLIYVGYWMHDKSHAQRWQAYLTDRLRGALGRRAAWGLGAVSFLAVYREVFETVLFYQALWLQVAPGSAHAVLGGLAAGAGALVVLSWLIVRGSLLMPLGVFFGATSAVLAALAVVLVGKGIAALQEAAVLHAYPVAAPRLPLLGVYPDGLGLALQAGVATVIVLGFAWRHRALQRAA